MTWNLWWKFGPWQERQPGIEAEIRRIDPDIAFLQEVYYSESDADDDVVDVAADDADQAARLGRALGLEVARTTDSMGQPQPFGNAILSRWPIRSAKTVPLPNQSGQDGHRSALFCEIETPHGLQLVVCTHLEWRYEQSVTRMAQLERICPIVKEWIDQASVRCGDADPAPLPPLLGGDFNAVPESDEVRRVTGLAAPYCSGLVFTDVWAATNETAGFTWTRANEHSVDAQWPNRRVDYLFVAWPRSKPQMNPRHSELAGLSPIEGVTPSDHYAVVGTLDDRDPF